MQPGEEIESLVDELEQIVVEAKSSFGGGGQKKIVDAEEIYGILDEIRRTFPQEFQDARRIIKEQGETLDRAQKQADAIIAARGKIVRGAVDMVEMALGELSERHVVDMDEDRRAAMVSNLLVVLCGDSEAQPVVNTGTIYQ